MQYTVNNLIETWSAKVYPPWWDALLMLGTTKEEQKANKLFEAIQTHLEPRLAEATGKATDGSFIGGAQRLTLFEVRQSEASQHELRGTSEP